MTVRNRMKEGGRMTVRNRMRESSRGDGWTEALTVI
jgi:hypothetical protein